MIEYLDFAKHALGPLAGTAGGGFFTWLAVRRRTSMSPPAAIAASQADLVSALNTQTQLLLRESAKDRRDLKRRVDRQGITLKKLSADVAECNGKHSACEDKVATLREEIDKLMENNPPASY